MDVDNHAVWEEGGGDHWVLMWNVADLQYQCISFYCLTVNLRLSEMLPSQKGHLCTAF